MSTMGLTSSPAIDSWQVAFEKLAPDLKASLIAVQDDKLDVLTSVLDEAEQKKKLCLRKRWKVQFHGKVIILRDVFDKIIAWVNAFKDIGDIAVQVNPVAASLPWAGVRFLLHTAVSDNHCFESTVQGLELVSHMIARYAAFEALYLQRGSAIHAELQSKLTSLYAQILIFLANGVKYFSQSAAGRMLKSVFQSSQNNQLKEIAKLDEEVEKLARIFDAQVQQHIHSDVEKIRAIVELLQSPLNRLIDASMIYAKTLQDQQFRDFLKWLSPVPYSHHHDRHSEERLPQSAKWLFHHPQYVAWKATSSSSLLLLHGIPGSGKTSLVSAVVDTFIDEKRQNSLAAPLAYFYCGDSKFGRARADADEIMRSLTRQLAVIDKSKHKIHEQVLLEYERRVAEAKLDGFEVPKLRSSDCADLILHVLGSNPAVIVVDGVDEVEEHRRHELLYSLMRIRDESASVIKIFLSSRDNSNIFAHLPDAVMLRIQEAETRQDMELFVRHRVSTAIVNQDLLDGNVPESLQEDLVNFLSDRAGEMFLWVNLQMERFCELKSKSSILEAMRERSKVTTATINHLYSEMLDRISETDSMAYGIATRAFSWLMCMHEPLSSEAFLAAVSTSDSDERLKLTLPELLAICSSLIVLDSKLDTIRFAHLSFKEFLEANPEFDIVRVNNVAAMSCLDTCIHNSPSDIEAGLRPEKEFELYAALYWANHYRAAAVNEPQDGCLALKLKEFAFYEDEETSLPFYAWLETAQLASDFLANDHVLKKELNAVMSSTMTPLFTACIYGLEGLFQIVVRRQDFDVNLKNLLGHTGLYLAAAFGRDEIIRLLLELGADVNVQCGKHGNSLYAASFGGHVAVVQLLIDHGANTRTPSILESALQASFLAGHEDVAKLLLENGFKISSQDDYDKVLEAASQAGFSEVAQHLTKNFPSFSKTNSYSSKLIDSAISKGQFTFLKRYIDKGLLPDHTVATAALFGQTEIASSCLDKGLDIEKEGHFGTPLRTASLMGHESTVRMLLERGANINACGPFGDALQAAAMKGYLSITNLLIQNKADVNNIGGYYGTALQAAAYRGHRDVAEALINAGSWITERGRCRDAFHAAAEAGQEAIISLFLERGYQFLQEPGRIMARRGPPPLYRNLLREASPNRVTYHSHREGRSQKSHTETPLVSPVSDFEEVFKSVRGMAVSETPEIRPANQVRRSHPLTLDQSVEDKVNALEVAASRDRETVVQRILESKEKLGVTDDHIGRALWAASKNGHARLVESIISAEVDLRSYIKGSLERAAWHGHIAIIKSLLKYEETWGPTNTYNWMLSEGYWPDEESMGDLYRRQNCHIEDWIGNNCFLTIILSGCRGGQPSSVMLALQLAEDTEVQKLHDIALQEAAASNSTNVIELLFQNGHMFKPDILSRAFQAAAKYGSKSALVRLVKNDHDKCLVEHYGNGFKTAVLGGHAEVVQFFIEPGAQKSIPDNLEELFVDAARKGYLDILKLMVGEMRSCESYRITLDRALNEACATGHRDVAEFLINAGANVNASMEKVSKLSDEEDDDLRLLPSDDRRSTGRKRQWPRTALQACLQTIPEFFHDRWRVREFRKSKEDMVTKQESVIKLLLENRADVNLVASYKRTPLHSAVLNCTEEIVRAMIEHGADIHTCVPEEGTPLQCAAWREVRSLPIVRALLEAGAEITVEETEEGASSLILNAALSLFGLGPSENSSVGSQFASYQLEDGQFIESESIEEVLTTGPGAVIKLLLQAKPELHAKDERFSLLLQMAAAAGDGDYVQLLIERNININVPGHYYGSALQAAARFGRLDCVQLLLQAAADVNIVQGFHGTPLQAAVKGAHVEVVRALINHGADVNLRIRSSQGYDSDEESALIPAIQLAVESKNLAIIKLLVDAGAEISQETPVLHLAAESGDLDMLRVLLDAGADVNSNVSDHSPVLITACGHGNVEMVELLLSRGADVNADGNQCNGHDESILSNEASALHRACAEGRGDIVQILLKSGANPEKRVEDSIPPLAVAAKAGHLEIMEQLLAAGAMIYDPPRIPNVLGEACQGRKSRATIEFLVKRLSDPLKILSACEEALSAARDSGDEVLFMFLLKQLPKTPALLSQACMFGSKDAVQLILAHGVDVNSDFESGGRALHVAAYHQRSGLIPLLIKKGADVRYVSSKYGAPVYAALEGLLAFSSSDWSLLTYRKSFRDMLPEVPRFWTDSIELFSHNRTREYEKMSSCEEIVRILLDSEAEVNTEARTFGDPLHLASYIGSLPLVQLLLEKGANINTSGGYFGSALLAAIYGDHEPVIKFLLDRGIDVNILSPELGTALHFVCQHKDRRMMRILLDHGADVNADGSKHESPLAALLSHESQSLEEKIILLLQYGDRLRIRTEDLRLAATISGSTIMKRVLEHDKNVQVTQDVIAGAAAGNDSDSVYKLTMLLERANGMEITPDILKSVSRPDNLKVLLQHKPRCEVSSEIFEAMAKRGFRGANSIEVLLEQEPSATPTASVVIAFLTSRSEFVGNGSPDLLQSLFDRNPDIEVTESMLAIAKHPGDLKFLLSRSPTMRISQDMLESAVLYDFEGQELLKVLLDHDKTLKIGSSGVLKACPKYLLVCCMEILLAHDPSLEISEGFILDVLRPQKNGIDNKRELTELLVNYNKKLVFTPEIRKAIDEEFQSRSDSDLKQQFLGLEKI